jgi:hypothetical protein
LTVILRTSNNVRSSATSIRQAAAIGDAPYRSSLLSGAFSLFFLSFVMSGNGNAVPQLFFQRFYPEQKTVLLSASLLVSTTAAIAAVVLSRRHRLSQQALIAAMLATVMAALALYLTRNGAVFIATIVLVQFAVNYLTNQLDHASIARAGALRRVNDAAGVLARLCGMLAAPAFFTALYYSKTVSLVSVGAIGLLASAGAAKLLMMPAVREAADPASSKHEQPPDRTDSFLFAFAVSIYVSLYLFGANIIYLLRDLLNIPYSDTRGGVAIVAMFSSALLANGLVAILRRKLAERAGCVIRVVPLAVPAVMLFVFGGSIALGFRPGFLIFLAGAFALGVAYGAFLWEVRDYASQAAQNDGKSVLVSWFNKMANVSSLIAFAIMLAIAATKTGAHVAYYVRLI